VHRVAENNIAEPI